MQDLMAVPTAYNLAKYSAHNDGKKYESQAYHDNQTTIHSEIQSEDLIHNFNTPQYDLQMTKMWCQVPRKNYI